MNSGEWIHSGRVLEFNRKEIESGGLQLVLQRVMKSQWNLQLSNGCFDRDLPNTDNANESIRTRMFNCLSGLFR